MAFPIAKRHPPALRGPGMGCGGHGVGISQGLLGRSLRKSFHLAIVGLPQLALGWLERFGILSDLIRYVNLTFLLRYKIAV